MKDHLISTCGEKCFFLWVRRLLCNCSYEYRKRICHCKMNNNMSFLQFMAKDDSTCIVLCFQNTFWKNIPVFDNCIFSNRIIVCKYYYTGLLSYRLISRPCYCIAKWLKCNDTTSLNYWFHISNQVLWFWLS